MIKRNDADAQFWAASHGMHDHSGKGRHGYGAAGRPDYGAACRHDYGAVGRHENEALGSHEKKKGLGNKKWQYDHESDRGLTLTQKRVLLWLTMMGNGRAKEYIAFYQKIASVTGISKRAARVHVAALEKKKFIVTSVIYRIGTRQAIGKRVIVTKYAPKIDIKSLQQKLSKHEMEKCREMRKVYDQKMKMWKMGVL